MRKTIHTYTQEYVDPLNITEREIDIRDIAHSLALQCRFNGHSHGMLSVARHSINVHDYITRRTNVTDHALAGLLHDASEAYLCDIPRPLKHQEFMAGYREAEDKLQSVIFQRFGLEWPMPHIVHEADDAILQVEINYGRFHFDTNWREDEQDFLKVFYKHRPLPRLNLMLGAD